MSSLERTARVLRMDANAGFTQVVGVGGIGTGMMIELEGDHTLGRNESRMGRALDARDYCKLHIVEHYIAVLMGADAVGAGKAENAFRVFAVGNVGGDAHGETLMREMAVAGIDTRSVRVEAESSTLFSVAFLYPDKSGGNITTSNSAACALSSAQLSECRPGLMAAGRKGVALCLPEVPLEARHEFLRLATECGSYRVASFSSGEMEMVCNLKLLTQVDLLALNYEEAAALVGIAAHEASQSELLDACAKACKAANPTMRMLVSAGADGAYIFEDAVWSHHQAVPVQVASTAGAGDALLAGTIAGLAAGLPLTDRESALKNGKREICSAIDLGLALAALSVTSPHAIHPEATLDSLLSFAKENGIGETENFKDRYSHRVATGA